MENTLIPGRIDIVIFPNGGMETIGRIAATPEIPENFYWPEVMDFVSQNQNLQNPQKFTGFYSVQDDKLKINFGNYAGEIPLPEYIARPLNGPEVEEYVQEYVQYKEKAGNSDINNQEFEIEPLSLQETNKEQ